MREYKYYVTQLTSLFSQLRPSDTKLVPTVNKNQKQGETMLAIESIRPVHEQLDLKPNRLGRIGREEKEKIKKAIDFVLTITEPAPTDDLQTLQRKYALVDAFLEKAKSTEATWRGQKRNMFFIMAGVVGYGRFYEVTARRSTIESVLSRKLLDRLFATGEVQEMVDRSMRSLVQKISEKMVKEAMGK